MPEIRLLLSAAKRIHGGKLDLRSVGIADAILSFDKYGRPKLEVVDVASKGFSGTCDAIASVIAGDPGKLLIIRADFCADTRVPISFFKCAEVKNKRNREVYRFGGESLYWGAGDDVLVIYDKAAEARHKWSGDASSFERRHGFSPLEVVSRVERRMKNRILHNRGFKSVADLSTAAEFDPFEPLLLPQSPACLPLPDSMGWKDKAAVLQMRSLMQREGRSAVKAFIAQHSPGNVSREMKSLSSYLGPDYDVAVSAEELLELYRDSTTRWLAA